MSYGHDTVTFVTVTDNPSVKNRYGNPQQVRTETSVQGCHVRPLKPSEKIELGDISKDGWKITAPPVDVVLNASATDEVQIGGNTYQIVGGIQVYNDLNRVFKVTIYVARVTS